MAPLAPTPSPRQRERHEPLFDINPLTGISIEVFFADRELETFGRCGAGWFWWPRVSQRMGFVDTSLEEGRSALMTRLFEKAALSTISTARIARGLISGAGISI